MTRSKYFDNHLNFEVSDHWFETNAPHYPFSLQHLQKAVLKRRCEFLAGRIACQNALKKIGHKTPFEIKNGENREPLWPHNIVGSITHSQNNAIARVAFKYDFIAVGIDFEQIMTDELAHKLWPKFASDEEFKELKHAGSHYSDAQLTTLIFSAKESIYKALFPLEKRFFGFEAVSLHKWDFSAHTFLIKNRSLTVDFKHIQLFGKFTFSNTHVFTEVSVRKTEKAVSNHLT